MVSLYSLRKHLRQFNAFRHLFGRHTGVALLFVIVIVGLWYWNEQGVRAQMSWEGPPQEQSLSNWYTWHRILRNDAYMVGWSDFRQAPLWVTYKLEAVRTPNRLPRPEGFSSDWRSLWPITPQTYSNSGYDRGHLAPNYAIAATYGREAQQQTFLMTNIAPQRPNLNRKLWQRLEAAEMDVLVPRFGALWIVAGPVYSASPKRLASCNGWVASLISMRLPACVSIPEAYYKILIVPGRTKNESARMLAFIFPQEVRGDEPLDRYLTTIDEVQRQTGLNFFPQLPALEQSELTSSVNTAGWPIGQFVRTPSRY